MRHCRVFLLASLSLILSTSQTFNIYTSHLEENEKGKNSRIVKLFMTINFQISLGPWNLKILLKFSTAQRIRCFRPRLENDLRLDATTGVYLSSNKDVQHKERWPSKQVSKKGLWNYSLAARTRWPYKSRSYRRWDSAARLTAPFSDLRPELRVPPPILSS